MITAYLISFREALEAALIVTIIIAYLRKIGKREYSRYLYLGTGLAVLASLILGWGVITIYGSLSKNAERIFEGVASISATVVLTYMIIWMAKNATSIKGELQSKVDVAVTTGQVVGIATLAFVSVFREGVETVLFLTTLAFTDPSGTIIGTILGLGTVLVLSYLMLKGVYRMNLQKFFKYTSVLLIVFAAGLFGYGVHELIEAGLLPAIVDQVWNINPPDVTHLLHEKGAIGSILKALVGYDGNPELLRVIAYLGYWAAMGVYLLKTYAPHVLRRTRVVNGRREEPLLEPIITE
jgi:high-affinity iron transporter